MLLLRFNDGGESAVDHPLVIEGHFGSAHFFNAGVLHCALKDLIAMR